ncbi:MAG TPA: histidine kinase dimerization/phosphoacceptor domain-containing protein [Solirubrobacteraceae bacterium]
MTDRVSAAEAKEHEDAAARGHASGPTPVRRRWSVHRLALLQFVLSSIALLVVIATIGAIALRRVATGEALRDARSVTVAFGFGVLAEHITPGLLRGEPAALDRLDRAVRDRVLGKPIVRIKVWTPQGRIVYSDARSLIGRTFAPSHDLRATLADGTVRAEVSDLSLPENRLERSVGQLVEVYLPLRLAGGERLLVEAYHPANGIEAASRRIWRTFLPVLFAVLLALAAAQLPLAWSHTRRGRAEARERERLARDAERALQAERGRIAVELHDGVVQDLAGVAYELHAAANRSSAPAGDGDLNGVLRRAADVCRGSMTRLRELLVDLRSTDPALGELDRSTESPIAPQAPAAQAEKQPGGCRR